MKTIFFDYGPKRLHLYLNGAAMFEIDALDGDNPADRTEALDLMQEKSPEGLTMLCRVAIILATQGELSRRYLQYSPQRIPSERELLLLLSPADRLRLLAAVIRAVNEGFGKSTGGEEEDIDTGLAELEKKTKP